jgi:Helix-turn-helix domain
MTRNSAGSGPPLDELSSWVGEHRLKQAEAAEPLMVSRPRVCDVVNGKTSKFTLDSLVEMLGRGGQPVNLAVDWTAVQAGGHQLPKRPGA